MSDNLNFEQISTILRRSLEESLEELLQENIEENAKKSKVNKKD